jgi:hypothetical protein
MARAVAEPPRFPLIVDGVSPEVTPVEVPQMASAAAAAATSHVPVVGEGPDRMAAQVPANLQSQQRDEDKMMGVEIEIGPVLDGFNNQASVLNLSDTNLNQLNMGIVGNLGTGKTQLLKSIIFQLTRQTPRNEGIKPRVLIFDYKKDYADSKFVEATGARVLSPRNLPVNLFDTSSTTFMAKPWLPNFQFFSDVLDKIYKGIGPVQRANLRKAISDSYDQCSLAGHQPTIYDVHSNYKATVPKADSVTSIIDDLVDLEIFSSKPSTLDSFDKFLDGVVVISLAELGQDDHSKNLLVAVMLNLFYQHMLRIPKRPYVGPAQDRRVVDSFLLVDEADSIMQYEFDVLRKILLQGREFGVGVILASQFLSHFKVGGTDYREPLLTWFIHKVPNLVAHELGALGLTGSLLPETAERIKGLGLHECFYKSYGVAGEFVKGTPFWKLAERASNKA